MVNMTLAIPEDLKIVMDKHKEVKWSEVARSAIREKAVKLELMDKILSKSRLTETDALSLGMEINKNIAKKHGLVK